MKEGARNTRCAKITVGVADVLPKLIVFKLLEPIYQMDEPVHLEVLEDKTDRLLAELALHHIDLVLTDSQTAVSSVKVKAYNHLLGECPISIMAVPGLARKLKDDFPKSLHGSPFLFPSSSTALRRTLEEWFTAHGIRPDNRGEFEDSALLKVFGASGLGAFAVPSAIENSVKEQFDVQVAGRIAEITERFYAVTVDRKLRSPAVVKVTESAKREIFLT
jgi:LysR family transcriptional activator of nhaA